MVSFFGQIHAITDFVAEERFPGDPSHTFSWYINMSLRQSLNFEDATAASRNQEESQHHFKVSLKQQYEQPEQGDLFDMATGEHLPHSTVVASHIFQHKWQSQLPYYTSLKNIDDARNGLLLYKPVEWAFNRGKLCIEVNSEGQMTFLLLDDSLRDVKLVGKACQLREERRHGNRPFGIENNIQSTFGDLDGQQVHFPKGTSMRPSKRLLGLHAVASWMATRHLKPDCKIPMPSYNASDDEAAMRSIKNISIGAWRETVWNEGSAESFDSESGHR